MDQTDLTMNGCFRLDAFAVSARTPRRNHMRSRRDAGGANAYIRRNLQGDSMTPLVDCAYAKMNGLGNEILVVDLRSTTATASAAGARALARAPGLGFDQLMTLHRPHDPEADAFVRIYNADGSEAGACGNGTRCVAWFLLRDSQRQDLRIETIGGPIDCVRRSLWDFTVDMGRPRLSWNEIPLRDAVADTRSIDLELPPELAGLGRASVVNMGNPHAIFWVENLEIIDLARLGPQLERHPMFPERANVSLAKIVSKSVIALKVWERGAGLTRACGTAACAAAVAAVRLEFCGRAIQAALPGGTLSIEWSRDDHVLMTGPCDLESEGRLDFSRLAPAAAQDDA